MWLSQGNAGSLSEYFASLRGEQGPQGEVGPAGPQGEQGEQGPQGVHGPAGSAGVGIFTTIAYPNGVVTFVYTDGSSYSTPSLTGPEGETGPAGPQGEQGPQGEMGPAGQPGSDGASSYDLWLSQGNSGTLADFMASLRGEEGPQGEPGPQGATGPQGEPGPQGEAGPQGPPGQPGETGLPSGDGMEVGATIVWDGAAWVAGGAAIAGCMDSTACNYDSTATVSLASACLYVDECGVCDGPGAIYECGCQNLPTGDCDCDGNELDALGVCGGGCTVDADNDGICDDGDSCVGQADECGVCNGPGAIYACGCSPVPEGDCDCQGTPDVDDDGICDNFDPCVGEFDATGVCNGGCQTDADGDGICDDNGGDPCFGLMDSCGVCNGPGPVEDCGCVPIAEGACDCAGNEPDAEGNCLDYLLDTEGDGVYDGVVDPCLGLTHLSYHNKNYSIVAIGSNCWFRENLATTMTRDSVALSEVVNYVSWNGLSTPAYAQYGNDPAQSATYGLLYNGFAANQTNLCPQGWALPTNADWQALSAELGGNAVAGGALKEAGELSWNSPNTGATNSSGFTALAAGQRQVGTLGDMGMGVEAWFWPKGGAVQYTPELSTAWGLENASAALLSASHSQNRGHSIRCLFIPVLGCTDPNFMEFNAEANADDGSCSVPAVYGCMSPNFVEYDSTANVDDGSCATLEGCGPEDVVTFDGYDYPVITIGNQCWLQENLQASHYCDGVSIPEIQDDAEWAATTTGAQCTYNNDVNNLALYGRLYNVYAALSDREICPVNWHVPQYSEWREMIYATGTTITTEYDYGGYSGYMNFDAAPLKVVASHPTTWNGTNTSGFSAVHGGSRYGLYYSHWESMNRSRFWIGSSQNSSTWYYAGSVFLHDNNSGTLEGDYVDSPNHGYSIRCVRDSIFGGCLDPGACNFTAGATIGTIQCEYPDYGHDCDGACLNDADDDGICDCIEIIACVDPFACNYDESVIGQCYASNGVCQYPEDGYDCAGDCLLDSDVDGICDPFEILGCTDATACNYNADITIDTDNSTCIYSTGNCEFCSGQTDGTGIVISVDADGDGICGEEVAGCLEPSACNYNVNATDEDGSCVFTEDCEACDNGSICDPCDPASNCFGDGVCDCGEVFGCTIYFACNFDETATEDDGSCLFAINPCEVCSGDSGGTGYVVTNDDDGDGICNADEIAGCMDPLACDYDPSATDPIDCDYPPGFDCSQIVGCTETSACNYHSTAAIADNENCIYPYPPCEYCSGQWDGTGVVISGDADGDGVCDQDEMEACTDPLACNYDDDPTLDFNYFMCSYTMHPCDTCSGESDGSGVVVTGDSDGDGVCDQDEISGCTDSFACNYDDAITTDPDWTLCVYPSIPCDSCSGETDGSGVVVVGDANGNGVCDVNEPEYPFLTGEIVATSDLGTTYRIYAEFEHATDELLSIYCLENWEPNFSELSTEVTTSFYQHELGGAFATDINVDSMALHPDLNYDSWLTIGSEDASDSTIWSTGLETALQEFEAGMSFTVNDGIGGAWFNIPFENSLALAGEDSKVLVGQFTIASPGSAEFTWNLQWRDGPTQAVYYSDGLQFSTNTLTLLGNLSP